MRFDFVCEEHQEFGVNGWRLKSHPDFDPLQGMAVAHDCLEHFRDGDESPADEFQALGAATLIRREQFESTRYGKDGLSANLSADMPDIWGHIVREGLGLASAPASAYRPIRDRHIETQLKRAVTEGLKEAHDMELFDSMRASEIAEICRDSIAWLRNGYRRAKRRFRDLCLYSLLLDFKYISRKADEHLKRAEIGDELTVKVCLKRQWVEVEYRNQWGEQY